MGTLILVLMGLARSTQTVHGSIIARSEWGGLSAFPVLPFAPGYRPRRHSHRERHAVPDMLRWLLEENRRDRRHRRR